MPLMNCVYSFCQTILPQTATDCKCFSKENKVSVIFRLSEIKRSHKIPQTILRSSAVLLFDLSALQIIPFVSCMPHRKSLSRKCSVIDHRSKEFVFSHPVKQKANGIFPSGQIAQRIFPVDIIHRDLRMFRCISEQK